MDISIMCDRFCEYVLSIKNHSKYTVKRHQYVIRGFITITRIHNLEEVTETAVRELFYHGRVQRKWTVNTYIVFRKSLLVFFRWCVQRGYLSKNPVDTIEIPKLEKRIPPKLTKQNALKLLEIVTNYPYESRFLRYRNHAIFSTFIFAGLRKQELLNLKYSDVDLENYTLFVRQGKGAKDRMIPISFTLAQSLKRYIDERKRLAKTNPEFFSSRYGNIAFTDTGLKRLVDQLRRSSRIIFTIHMLRHTFATLMLEGGCDIYSLSKMMGHSDINTTTIYLSASVEHLRNQIVKHPMNDDFQQMRTCIPHFNQT